MDVGRSSEDSEVREKSGKGRNTIFVNIGALAGGRFIHDIARTQADPSARTALEPGALFMRGFRDDGGLPQRGRPRLERTRTARPLERCPTAVALRCAPAISAWTPNICPEFKAVTCAGGAFRGR
jgi:hypothetical protein